MNKLYQKSELWFALAWIGVYVVGGSLADGLSRALGAEKLITLLLYGTLSVVALIWLQRNDLLKKYGLCRPGIKAKSFLYYLPLAAMASCNLWFGTALNYPLSETVFYVVSMLCVGFLEELIFRGFLFKAMEKDGLRSAVIVSSLTFGIGHIVNLFNGSGADLVSNLCQICSAVAFGFLFVIMFYRGGSLLPCIAAHSTLNALSAFADEAAMAQTHTVITSVILTTAAFGYTAVLLKTLPQKE